MRVYYWVGTVVRTNMCCFTCAVTDMPEPPSVVCIGREGEGSCDRYATCWACFSLHSSRPHAHCTRACQHTHPRHAALHSLSPTPHLHHDAHRHMPIACTDTHKCARSALTHTDVHALH